MIRHILLFSIAIFLVACNDNSKVQHGKISAVHDKTLLELKGLPVESGVSGRAGKHTPVSVKSINNSLGFYEYLPKNFNSSLSKLPLIIYWNGQNSGAGDGDKDLHRLLGQGLPMNIQEGAHYPAIIISPMTGFKEWKIIDADPFVDFLIKRYGAFIDEKRIYMTGFSGGGGLTMRYAMENPQRLAAIVVVAAAVQYPEKNQPSDEMKKLPIWLFHNDKDKVVSSDRSTEWFNKLKKSGFQHRLTIYESDSHYAWQEAYGDQLMWEWLFSHSR